MLRTVVNNEQWTCYLYQHRCRLGQGFMLWTVAESVTCVNTDVDSGSVLCLSWKQTRLVLVLETRETAVKTSWTHHSFPAMRWRGFVLWTVAERVTCGSVLCLSWKQIHLVLMLGTRETAVKTSWTHHSFPAMRWLAEVTVGEIFGTETEDLWRRM